MSIINIDGLNKNYGKVEAVKNLSIEIPKGKIVGFVGKNGAGKSTTIRAILSFIFPTKGQITVAGYDSVRDAKKIREKIAYAPSEAAFYENLTCRQVLKFAGKFAGATQQYIEELADYFELDLDKKVEELSLGNRKKVSLIQCFIKKSEIIILDEPTSGLDPLMQGKFFRQLIKEKEKGTTIFLSSHNLSEVERYCDNVAIIKDGELVDYFDMENITLRLKQVVTYTTIDGIEKSYEITGNINEVITELSKLNLTRLEIKGKTVEDEFIDYYKEVKNG